MAVNNEIETAIKQFLKPLFVKWSTEANLTEIEIKILFLKLFDERNLNEYEQIKELQKEFNYYYDLRTYQNHWKNLKKKIIEIL